MSATILVATTNRGKLAELSAMLALDVSVKWVGLDAFAGLAEVVEDGADFAENARIKALGYARATGLWTLADDSGLVIDALGGEPGVLSARYSGPARPGEDRRAVDKRNNLLVLERLRDVADERRTSRFVCCLCLAEPSRVLIETRGILEGRILRGPRGESGFGYDPIFYVPELGRTVAELGAEEKNAVSHRGRAVAALRPKLARLLAT